MNLKQRLDIMKKQESNHEILVREIKKLPEDMPPAEENWYSEQPDSAEPPMRQALYGPGEDLFQDLDSLKMIVEDVSLISE